MSEEYLTDEDLAAIDAIIEGSYDRQHGQHILDAVAASEARRQGGADHWLLKAIEEAHRAKVSESGAEAEANEQ
jgi:hypothetical protein